MANCSTSRSRAKFWCAIALCAACGTPPSYGAAPDGRFGVKGVGAARCSAFVEAYENRSEHLQIYGGWIDGFVTGLNHERDEMFDIAPWQTSEALAYALAGYCRRNQKLSFFQAMLSLKAALLPDALTEYSPIVIARRDGKGVAVYSKVLRELRERLKANGFLKEIADSESFDGETADALARFQRSMKLEETGLPDQATVGRLMRKN